MRTIISFLFLITVLTAPAQPVNVMTYNIRYDNPGDGVNQWSSRKEKVFALLDKYDPGIVGVQEALHHQLVDIRKNLPEYAYVGVGRDDGKEKGEYSAIFYNKDRFEVLEQNTFWLSETPEVPGSKSWDASITRVATWARMRDKKANREFVMINTHFDHIGKEARRKSAELLKMKASALAKGLPVIISGDFNCMRDDAPYQVMLDPAGVPLTDPAPADAPGTFCTFQVNAQPCRAIDYIFHTPQWSSSTYIVIQDNDGRHYPSDHLPVMVSLEIKKN